MQAFAAEHGSFGVIIDDGAHLSDAQQISFFTLWPMLKLGGFCFIEYLHFQPPTKPADTVKTKALFHGWRGASRHKRFGVSRVGTVFVQPMSLNA